MKDKKQCYHCGTTEDVTWGVWWVWHHELCEPCRNKYDTLRSKQHSELSKFLSKAGVRNPKEERKPAYAER